MHLSRSKGHEDEPPSDTLFKGFGNFYTGYPNVMWMCKEASRSQSGHCMFKEFFFYQSFNFFY